MGGGPTRKEPQLLPGPVLFRGCNSGLDEPRKKTGYPVFLLAFFAIVLQVNFRTEIQILPLFVFHKANRLQTIGTTLHLCASSFGSLSEANRDNRWIFSDVVNPAHALLPIRY